MLERRGLDPIRPRLPLIPLLASSTSAPISTMPEAPSPEWQASMRLALDQLSSALLRVGITAAEMACTPEQRERLRLCSQETADGMAVATIEQLRLDIAKLTNEAAMMAQAVVSKAAAAPDDPRR